MREHYIVSGMNYREEGRRCVVYSEEMALGSHMSFLPSFCDCSSIVSHNPILPRASGQTTSKQTKWTEIEVYQHRVGCSRTMENLRFYLICKLIVDLPVTSILAEDMRLQDQRQRTLLFLLSQEHQFYIHDGYSCPTNPSADVEWPR